MTWLAVCLVLVAALGVALQIAGIVFASIDVARGCPDCRKGALCERCLAESEAIRPGGSW